MFKWLLIIGLVLLTLAILGLFLGVSAQQPFAFGASILCLVPLAAYFLGGATFNIVANYQIMPKGVQGVGNKSLSQNRSNIG